MTQSDAHAYWRDLFEDRRSPFDFDFVTVEDLLTVLPLDIRYTHQGKPL